MNIKTIAGSICAAAMISCSPNRPPKQPIKIVDRIVADSFAKENPKNILVIDDFHEENVNVDLDFFPDAPHGYITSKIIENGLPDSNVKKIDIPMGNGFYEKSKDKHAIFGPIFDDIKEGKNYDAVNLSIGVPMPFEEFSKQTGIQVDKESLKSKVREIKDYLIKNPNKSLYNKTQDSVKIGSVVNFIDDLDSISSKGAKIYVAAGNSGKENFNMISLIDNSVSVGAVDYMGGKAVYSADNSLVTRWVNDVLQVKNTDKGYNFTGGDGTDIEYEYTTSLFRLPGFSLQGTSYSAPKALVEDMKKTN